MKNKTLFAIAFGLLAALPSGLIASELEALQGKWESRFQEQGKALRVLKIIDKNRETVETYDGDRLVHRHVVTLEEKQAEGITVMHYGESEVTHGPRKGQRGKPGSFVSKRLGDTWYNVQGLETSSETPFTVIQFKRLNEPTQTENDGDAAKIVRTITCTEVADGALWPWYVTSRDSVTCSVIASSLGRVD